MSTYRVCQGSALFGAIDTEGLKPNRALRKAKENKRSAARHWPGPPIYKTCKLLSCDPPGTVFAIQTGVVVIVHRLFAIAALSGVAMSPASAQVSFGFHDFQVRVPVHNYHAQANQPQCRWKNAVVNGRSTREWLCRDDYGNWYVPQEPDAGDNDGPAPVHNYHATSSTSESSYPVGGRSYESNVQAPMPQTPLDKSLDAIVTQDSHSWGFFRYDYGSMHDAAVISKSKDGRTVELRGNYTFNAGSHGWVKVKMVDGQVDCLEFWNEGRCRALGNSPTVQALRGFGKSLVEAMKNPSPSSYGGSGNNEAQREYERQQQQNDILANHEIQQSMGNP